MKKYKNIDIDKETILQDNTQKSGIYMFKNLINGKRYIGSSENLKRRFLQYFNTNFLLINTHMLISRALLKHGYFNFSLEILEYCEPPKCLAREKYYLKLLKPEYNISLDPTAPFAGRTHSDESRKKISDAKKGENNPMYGQPKVKGSGRPSQLIEVFDLEEKTTTSYNSIGEAARALNIHRSVIDLYFIRNQTKPYKGRYTFSKAKSKEILY
jgi:excinuclease UvrABC nuclease subunit